MNISVRTGFVAMLVLLTVPLFYPVSAQAQANIASAQDALCVKICTAAAAHKKPCPTATQQKCAVTVGASTVVGVCMIDGCKAIQATGVDGVGNTIDPTMAKLLLQLGQSLLQMMMQGGGGGGGGTDGSGTCNPTTPTDDPTLAANYPCIYTYQQSISNILGSTTSGISNQLLNNLYGTGGGSSSSSSTNTTNQNTTPQNTNNTSQTTNTTAQLIPIPHATPFVAPGVQGDITLTQAGATIFGSGTDLQNQTAVIGFFGGDGEGQGVASRLCAARPWALSVVSVLLSPTFFDNLCAWKGYQVGTPKPAVVQKPTVSLAQKPVPKATSTPVVAQPYVAPLVQIWAVPEKVSVGQRASIFWRSQGVTSCTETSPDGSFNGSSLVGNAATVPITADTVFTISCISASSTPVSSSVTVKIAL